MKKCEFCDKEHGYFWVIKGITHLMCKEHFEAMEEQAKRNDLVKNIFKVAKEIAI